MVDLKIIYATRNNSYAALEAAYLHLNIESELEKDIIGLESMRFYYLGLDYESNEVYIINYYKNKHIFRNIVNGFAKLYDKNVLIVDLD